MPARQERSFSEDSLGKEAKEQSDEPPLLVLLPQDLHQGAKHPQDLEKRGRLTSLREGARAARAASPKKIEIREVRPSLSLFRETENILEQAYGKNVAKELAVLSASLKKTSSLCPIEEERLRIYHGSYEEAMLAVSTTILAIRELLSPQRQITVAAVRPPGHHAGPPLNEIDRQWAGYCLLNNLGTALYWLYFSGYQEEISIVDLDAHFGNGMAQLILARDLPWKYYSQGFGETRDGTTTPYASDWFAHHPLTPEQKAKIYFANHHPRMGSNEFLAHWEENFRQIAQRRNEIIAFNLGFDLDSRDKVAQVEAGGPYVKLPPGTNPKDLFAQIASIINKVKKESPDWQPKFIISIEGGYSQEALREDFQVFLETLDQGLIF